MTNKSRMVRKIARNAFQGLFFLASCLLLPASSSAQSPVNVTATVKDSAGIPYSNATVSILLIPTGTAPTVGGAQISGTNNGQLDVNGKLNVSLYKNTDIVPASSQWQFTICETPGVAPPLGTGGQCFTSSQTVSAAVDFSTQFQAAAKALTTVTVGGSGSVTHTAGNLTAGNVVIGNGAADVKVDSACVTNGTGALSGCTSITTPGTVAANALTSTTSLVLGAGASACGAGTTACFAGVEAATACTPTAGQICKRFDSVLNNSVTSANGAAEVPDLLLTAPPAGSRCLQTSGTSGGTAETANPCGTATVLATGTNPPACAVATSAWCGGESVSPTLVAQVDDIHPDITNHCEDVANGLAENGCIVGSSQTIVTIGSGADIAATSLCSTVNCPVGTYRVNVYIDMSTPCGTTGTFIAWLGYTDDSGARTGSSTTTFFDIQGTGAVPATGTLTTTSTANYGQATYILRTTGAATGGLGSINYGATRTACGSAGPMVGKMYLTVERIGFL